MHIAMDHLIVINALKPGGHTFGDHGAHGGLIFSKVWWMGVLLI